MGLRSLSKLTASVVALALMTLSSSAMATLLNPGTTVAPGATASPAAAALVVDSGAQPFTSVDGTSFSGTLRTQVYTNDAGNPFGLAGLTFTYLLTNNGPDALERLVTVNFSQWSTDVGVNATLVPRCLIGILLRRVIDQPTRSYGMPFVAMSTASSPRISSAE